MGRSNLFNTEERAFYAIQENLMRVNNENPQQGLYAVSDNKQSAPVEFLQKGLNELGKKDLLGSDFTPLEVTGKIDPAFVAAMNNYLATKRGESTDIGEYGYKNVGNVTNAASLTSAHIGAVMDSLIDNGILTHQNAQGRQGITLHMGGEDITSSFVGILRNNVNSTLISLSIENLTGKPEDPSLQRRSTSVPAAGHRP